MKKGSHYAIGSNSLATCFETVYVCRFCWSPCSKKTPSAQKENPQAAVRIFIWHLPKQFFSIKQLSQKVLFFSFRPCVFHGAEPWLKGFVRCVRNARSPFVALSLRVVATMCALALVGQGGPILPLAVG